MSDITLAQAIDDSEIKWEYAAKTGCSCSALTNWLYDEYRQIYEYTNCCGLCEYVYSKSELPLECKLCLLRKTWGVNCINSQSLWAKWRYARIPRTRKHYASLILKDIRSLRCQI